MRKYFLSLVLLAAGSLNATSQVTQNCIIKEYRGEKTKKPISNAVIIVSGAGSNVSDKNGCVLLQFREAKAGDKVVVKQLKKDGCEIFNKDALERWRIGNDNEAFEIVMCKSSDFKRLKDNYYATSSKSYANQLKLERENADKLLQEGKIAKEEYERTIVELQKKYDEHLENLDNYIDKFARIDLSELSSEEKNIIQMVQDGLIDKAIDAYENLNLIDKLQVLSAQNEKIDQSVSALLKIKKSNSSSQEDIYSSITNMSNLLMLKGGRENVQKAIELLKKAASLMPDNYVATYNCAVLLKEQYCWKDAIEWYQKALELKNLTPLQLSLGECGLAETYLALGSFSEARAHCDKAKEIISDIQNPSPAETIAYIKANTTIAHILNRSYLFEQSAATYSQSLSLCDSLIRELDSSEELMLLKHKIQYGLCDALIQFGDFKRAKEYAEETLKYLLPIANTNKKFVSEALAGTYINLGNSLFNLGDYDKSLENSRLGLEVYESLYEKYPDAYADGVAVAYNRIVLAYYGRGEMDNCMAAGKQELKYRKEACKCGGDFSKYNYSMALNNMGYIAYMKKQYGLAKEYYLEALSLTKALCEKYYSSYITEHNRVHINIMTLLLAEGSIADCAQYDDECLKEAEYLNKLLGSVYQVNYLLTYFNHGEYCARTGNLEKARKALDLILSIDPKYFETRADSMLAGLMKK